MCAWVGVRAIMCEYICARACVCVYGCGSITYRYRYIATANVVTKMKTSTAAVDNSTMASFAKKKKEMV